MFQARFAAFLTAALALVGPAAATEEAVRFQSEGLTVVGTLNTPDGELAPVVLLLHGFTGSRDELPVTGTDEGVFSRTARLLSEAGYASLRIDFRGSGESDGSFADTTFEGQVTDALAALEFLAGEARVDGGRIAVIGWSQGGLVATAVAGRSGAPQAVALWAAVAAPQQTFGMLLGEETITAGVDAEGPVPITLPWGVDIELNAGFFEGIRDFDPVREIGAYGGPLFVAQGTLDDLVLPASADLLIAGHGGESELWLKEMDHVFGAFTGPEILDEMVQATITFFSAHID